MDDIKSKVVNSAADVHEAYEKDMKQSINNVKRSKLIYILVTALFILVFVSRLIFG